MFQPPRWRRHSAVQGADGGPAAADGESPARCCWPGQADRRDRGGVLAAIGVTDSPEGGRRRALRQRPPRPHRWPEHPLMAGAAQSRLVATPIYAADLYPDVVAAGSLAAALEAVAAESGPPFPVILCGSNPLGRVTVPSAVP